MPYRYESFNPGPRYENRFAGQIGATLRDMGTQKANQALTLANINAQETANRGRIWGQTIEQLGDIAGNLPMQLNQAAQIEETSKLREMQNRRLTAQLQQEERAQATRDQVNSLMADQTLYGVDGTINVQELHKRMSNALPAGDAGPVQPIDLKALYETVEPVNRSLVAARTDRTNREAATVKATGEMAAAVLKVGKQTGSYVEAGTLGIGSLMKAGLIPEDVGAKMMVGLVEHPEVTQQRLQEMVALAGLGGEKPIVVPQGSALVNPSTFQPLYENAPPPKPVNKQYQTKEMLLDGKRTALSFDPDTNQWLAPGSTQPLDPARVGTAPPEVDPTVAAIRNLTLETARQAAQNRVGQLPPATQKRVDIRTRAFDAQPVVKRATTMAEAVNFANGLDINTKNPADDQALIYAFAKAMDPDSVVREGEYATVQKYAQSWAQSLGFDAARVFSNTPFLTTDARQNMKTTIGSKFAATQQQYDAVRQSFAGQISRMTGQPDGDTYLTDYGAAFPGAAAPAEGIAQNSGGLVRMRAPNGQVQSVPAAQVDHYRAQGAVVVP